MPSTKLQRSLMKSTSDRRYSARYLLLSYLRTPADFDVNEIPELLRKEEARCVISRITTKNTNKFLVFVDFSGKRFQRRNMTVFDVQGHHPEWYHVNSEPWKAYDFCTNSGTIIWDEAPRPSPRSRPVQTTRSLSWDVLTASNDKDDFLEKCADRVPTSVFNTAKQVVNDVHHMISGSKTAGNVSHTIQVDQQLWKEGFQAGFEMGLKACAGKQAPLQPETFVPFVTPIADQLVNNLDISSIPAELFSMMDRDNTADSVDGLLSPFPQVEDQFAPWEV